MHSNLQRLAFVGSTALTAAFVLIGAIAFTGNYALPSGVDVDVRVTSAQVANGRYDIPEYRGGVRGDYALLEVDLDADLTSLWNWNTKLLFVNLVAEFATPGFTPNKVTIWDRIIHSKDDADLHLVNIRNSYALATKNHKFPTDQAINVTLQWNVVPWVGIMRMQRQTGRVEQIILPNSGLPKASPPVRL